MRADLDRHVVGRGRDLADRRVARVEAVRLAIGELELRGCSRQIGEQQGQVVDDATLDMIVGAMGDAAQSTPVDQTVEMVRENGAWKICSDLTLLPG